MSQDSMLRKKKKKFVITSPFAVCTYKKKRCLVLASLMASYLAAVVLRH